MKKLLAFVLATAFLFGCSPNSFKSKPERKVGVAMYTFHKRGLDEVVPLLMEMGVDAIGLSGTLLGAQFPKVKTGYKMTAEQKAYLKKLLADNNMKVVSYGVITPKTEADIVAACEFAKEMGIPLILTEALDDTIPLWEKYCEKYGLKMALHNHASDRAKYNMYFNPNIVLSKIGDNKNILACPDNGHWARSGISAKAGYQILKGKIAMLHFKDLDSFDNLKAKPVPHGKGVLKVKELMAELDKLGYNGYYMIEYEKNFDDNIADVRECVKFLKSN